MELNNLLYIAYDADNAGRKIGRAILADDPEQLKQDSERIELGNEIVAEWANKWGGISYSSGGDQGLFSAPQEALEELEQLRTDYQFATNLTMTVGVGASLSEAGKALLVGKFRGKNMVVIYDANIEKEIDQAQQNVTDGDASSEERKLSEAYLKPEDKETKPREEQLADYAKDGSQPPQIDKPDPKKEPKQGMNIPAESPSMNNNPGAHNAENKNKKPTPRDQEDRSQDKENAEDRAIESNNEQVENKHSEAAMRSIAQAIEGDETQGETEKDKLSHVDDEDMADTSGEMEENTSRPDGYKDKNKPGDLGLSEDDDIAVDEPDLSSVLRDGLDSHAENMQRDKVINMVSQALEGFKANKHILERAKEKAPQLYDSCLSMLKAMIEMTKMLGMGAQEENPLSEDAEANVDSSDPTEAETHPADQFAETDEQERAAAYGDPTVENDEQQADTHDEENCPYCKDPHQSEESDPDEEENCPYCEDTEDSCPYCDPKDDDSEGASKETPKKKTAPPAKSKKPAASKEGAAPSPKTAGQ